MTELLIPVINACTRAVFVIDDHPMGGIIICMMLLSAGLLRIRFRS